MQAGKNTPSGSYPSVNSGPVELNTTNRVVPTYHIVVIASRIPKIPPRLGDDLSALVAIKSAKVNTESAKYSHLHDSC